MYEKGKYNSIDEVRYIMPKSRCDGDVTVDSQRFVFQHLPEPNRSCLVGVYAVTLDPLRSLYGIIYVTGIPDSYQKLPASHSGSFRYIRSRDLPDTYQRGPVRFW